ncbi:MAG: phosphoribosylglycinamide formyltransferase [Culturomica sp.]|jgi:phosphoribosylglycinamide formyltransferase-1|nr:phosphoribosylglycinamide formyltransferase [Culturomica sp.]
MNYPVKKIAIFASGSGSNAENIIRFFGQNPGISVDSVYCNVPGAFVLQRAGKYGIPSRVFNRRELQDPEGVLKQLRERGTDVIVLAGFLWLIPPGITEAFPGRIINIHPALLPSYGGKGMYGMNVHRAVVAAGEKESGITIHLVNGRYDEGDILFQARCPVTPEDTPENVADKVHALEYEHFPRIIEQTLKQL